MAQFSVPSSPTIHVYQNNDFLGCDFTSDASTVDDSKSPNCVNMIRSVPAKVRKRMGYHQIIDYGEPINGVHKFIANDAILVHAGNKMYNFRALNGKDWVNGDDEVVDHNDDNIVLLSGLPDPMCEDMADHRSVSYELNNLLIILDGTSVHYFDGEKVGLLSDIAYIPTLYVGLNPDGSSVSGEVEQYESVNLIQPAWIEQFTVDSSHKEDTVFQLSRENLDATPVKAWVLDEEGEWVEKTEGTDFTVDRTLGTVTFVTAPGLSPALPSDNVKIQAYRTPDGYMDQINHCTVGALFGVGGANDRLFLSGNTDKGKDSEGNYYNRYNWDWHSEIYDPTYFADDSYSRLGSDATPIMGYSIISNYLATHKGGNEQAQSILLREGDLVDNVATFKLVNTLQGTGAVARYSFCYLETEPLFLTSLGVFAVTAQDITGEKYAQNRSYYLDGKLLEEDDLENAFAYVYKDFYLLCINDHVYILDGLQPIRTDKSQPYATRQYVGFYWENVPARVFFEVNDELYFGASDGKVYKFYTDENDPYSYNDNGEEIDCVWETADIAEQLFYKNKTYRYLALRCMPEAISSVEIWGQRHGLWEMIKEDSTTLKYFSFDDLDFPKFSFSTDATAKVSSTKVRLKKLDHVRFRFKNEKLNEPLAINDFALEYTQNGNHKG